MRLSGPTQTRRRLTEAGVGARLSRQDIVDAYDRLGSVRAAAAALGINARTVRVHL